MITVFERRTPDCDGYSTHAISQAMRAQPLLASAVEIMPNPAIGGMNAHMPRQWMIFTPMRPSPSKRAAWAKA
jgi:hypothetical protein